MKTFLNHNPSKSTMTQMINRSEYASVMTIDIQSKTDIRKMLPDIERFVSNDLSKVSVLVMKHR